MNGCYVYLSPTTYRCMDIDALRHYHERYIGNPGMAYEQFRRAYEHSQISLTYDDTEEAVVYLKHGACPIWRYRFDKGRLVARGYLVQEMGFWGYVETNYEETIIIEKYAIKNGVRIKKREPVYNEQGELTGVKETWHNEMNQNQ